MLDSSALLIAAVAAVGILHTIVPDHWVPITLIARRHGWSRGETARAALQAGTGHILSTLMLGLIVWFAGAAAAEHFGNIVDMAASLALVAFGGWFAVFAWLELPRSGTGHDGDHHHPHAHWLGDPSQMAVGLDGPQGDDPTGFPGHRHRGYGHHHDHPHHHGENPRGSPDGDDLYIPLAAAGAVQHRHLHRHSESAPPHIHWHDHSAADDHSISSVMEIDAPLHQHRHKTRGRTALLLILGSSPMIEGIPAFFAAERYGAGMMITMALVFAASTIATYVLLCVYSAAGLQRVRLGPLERYGEVFSGIVIAGVGLAFWVWPVV